MSEVAHQGLGDPGITPLEMLRFAGTGDPAAVAERLARMRQDQARAKPIDPEHPDPEYVEDWARREFALEVGRPPSGYELSGLPVPHCAACVRMCMSYPCDDHHRAPGTKIPRPPRPWPSEQLGYYPGTYRISSGPDKVYNVLNSVQ